MAVATRMGVDEYLELPERPLTNLVEGEVVVAHPLPLHQRTAGRIFVALHAWAEAAPGRGEVTLPLDVLLDEHNVFGPDVLWWRKGRGPGGSEQRPQPLPDIAVEVRSPSTWRHDIGPKKARYEQHGLPELWLVDTAASEVIVFGRSASAAATFDRSLQLGAGDELTSPLLPGFALALAGLFGQSPAA